MSTPHLATPSPVPPLVATVRPDTFLALAFRTLPRACPSSLHTQVQVQVQGQVQGQVQVQVLVQVHLSCRVCLGLGWPMVWPSVVTRVGRVRAGGAATSSPCRRSSPCTSPPAS